MAEPAAQTPAAPSVRGLAELDVPVALAPERDALPVPEAAAEDTVALGRVYVRMYYGLMLAGGQEMLLM